MKPIYRAVLICAVFCMAGLSGGHAATIFTTKLYLSTEGLALSSFPTGHVLTRTIRVKRTQGATPVPWTATSDQSWLTVTPSGMTGDQLKITADPSHLKADHLSRAQVTVSTSDGDFTDTEQLRVGIWVGSTDPKSVVVSRNATHIATNPVEPVAYISNNGSSIYEYNVYTGALIKTLKNVAPTTGDMETSSDGNTLFVADTTNYQILALDADTGALIASYPLGYVIDTFFNMAFARPFGQPAIYPAGGPAIAFPSGDILTSKLSSGIVAATSNGRKVYVLNGDIYAYSVTLKNNNLTLTHFKTGYTTGANCQALAVSHNGAHVYPACGAPYEFDVYDGTTLAQVQTLPAHPYPNNATIDVNDNFVGGINGLYEPEDIFVYDQQGFSKGTVPTTTQSYEAGQQNGAMRVSGDGTRVISVTGAAYNSSQTLMFRNLP